MSSAALPRSPTVERRTAVPPANIALGLPDTHVSVRLVRAATVCLAFHAALSLFSAVAFATFLSGAPPAWLAEPANQRALQIGWTFGPATTVVLGALAGLLHAAGRLGARRAALIFVVGFAIALAAELSGTHTGYPFGPYSYSGLLGYKVLGLVPFNIPTSWFFMLYCSLAICGRLFGTRNSSVDAARNGGREKWAWAVAAGVILTAWDVSMDPAMVRTAHWMWHLAPAAQQTWWQHAFVSDLFYGMPLSNWLGWLLTGTIVCARDARHRASRALDTACLADDVPPRALRGERCPADHDLRALWDDVGGSVRRAGDGSAARARRARGPAGGLHVSIG